MLAKWNKGLTTQLSGIALFWEPEWRPGRQKQTIAAPSPWGAPDLFNRGLHPEFQEHSCRAGWHLGSFVTNTASNFPLQKCWVSFRPLFKLCTALVWWVCPALLTESFKSLLGYQVTLVGLLCLSWEQGLWEKGQSASGCFLSFGIQSDCLFYWPEEYWGLRGSSEGKGDVCWSGFQHGMGPAACHGLQGGWLAGTGAGTFLCCSFWCKKLK